MKRLTGRATAWLLGLASIRSLSDNMSIPRNEDKTYNAQDVLRYAAEDRRRRKDRPGDQDRIAANSGDASPLDFKRSLEAQKLQLEILKLEKQLVPVSETAEFFGEMCSRLRRFGEVLQRDYGPQALVLLNELLGGMESHIDRWTESVAETEADE